MITLRMGLALLGIFAVASMTPAAAQTPSPAGAKVYIINLKDGHFGGGQTEAMVTLPKGTHTLQLVLADWSHIPHVPPVMSEPITITVR
jgi:hypothetical protein